MNGTWEPIRAKIFNGQLLGTLEYDIALEHYDQIVETFINRVIWRMNNTNHRSSCLDQLTNQLHDLKGCI